MIYNEAAKDNKVKGINLSRNFGQHYAITAGLNYAKGDWIVVIDGDLQDVTEEIENLYKKANNGFKIVCTQRKIRKDKKLKILSSLIYYKKFEYLTSTKQYESIANFDIYNRKVIDSILSMNDHIRYFPTMVLGCISEDGLSYFFLIFGLKEVSAITIVLINRTLMTLIGISGGIVSLLKSK